VQVLKLDAQQAADLLAAGRKPAPDWPAGEAGGLRIRVLGSLAAWRAGSPLDLGGPALRAVLGLLALHHGTGLHREAIIDALWAERPPATAVSLVQAYVSRLRRLLDPGRSARDPQGLLTSGYGRYALHATARQLDLLAFGELADRARDAGMSGDLGSACALYEQALELWRGEPLADVELLRRHPAVQGLDHTRTAVVIRYSAAAFGAGQAERALPHLRDLAWRDPLNEAAHAQLMIALAATGQQAAALRVYDGIRDRLDHQLGVRPSRELADAHLRVLRQAFPAPPFADPAAELRRLSRQLEETTATLAILTRELRHVRDWLASPDANPGRRLKP
jgi:DNA-binding SARP family transcriptional activator